MPTIEIDVTDNQLRVLDARFSRPSCDDDGAFIEMVGGLAAWIQSEVNTWFADSIRDQVGNIKVIDKAVIDEVVAALDQTPEKIK